MCRVMQCSSWSREARACEDRHDGAVDVARRFVFFGLGHVLANRGMSARRHPDPVTGRSSPGLCRGVVHSEGKAPDILHTSVVIAEGVAPISRVLAICDDALADIYCGGLVARTADVRAERLEGLSILQQRKERRPSSRQRTRTRAGVRGDPRGEGHPLTCPGWLSCSRCPARGTTPGPTARAASWVREQRAGRTCWSRSRPATTPPAASTGRRGSWPTCARPARSSPVRRSPSGCETVRSPGSARGPGERVGIDGVGRLGTCLVK